MSIYIGVDPGNSGAIAAINDSGECVGWHGLHCYGKKPKTTERDIWDWLGSIAIRCEMVMARIEFVTSFKQGRTSAMTFGKSVGFVRGMLTACSVPFEDVTPNKWQTAMKCRSGGDKNVTKAAAQRLFPTVKITHANADALLIAEFTRRLGR